MSLACKVLSLIDRDSVCEDCPVTKNDLSVLASAGQHRYFSDLVWWGRYDGHIHHDNLDDVVTSLLKTCTACQFTAIVPQSHARIFHGVDELHT